MTAVTETCMILKLVPCPPTNCTFVGTELPLAETEEAKHGRKEMYDDRGRPQE
jgi:hypothetical protein